MPSTADDGRPVVVVVRSQRRPHEIMLMLFSAVYGVVFVAGLPLPESLSAAARVAAVGFFALSGLGGLTGVIVAAAGRRFAVDRAIRLELGANLLVAAAGVLYVYAILSLSGRAAWLVVLLIACVWITGSIWRAGQLLADLRQIRKEAR